jgi:hypothetical protein
MSNAERMALISTGDVEKLMLNIRGMNVLLDRDVAMLYGVETRDINKAVKNNPKKFPHGYILELMPEEKTLLVEDFHRFNSLKHSTSLPKAFTERGLYMLATILKSPRSIEATIAIIDTFSMTRQLSRTMESLQSVEDGCEQQKGLLQKTGEILSDIVGRNLATSNTETEIEFNFAIVKIKHRITRDKE